MTGPIAILRGAAAGAAGTTALNTTTYLDMVLRARPASSTPQDTVEQLSKSSGIGVPGAGAARTNRIEGLAPLLGLGTRVGGGVVLGLGRALGVRPPAAVDVVAATAIALVGANGPMAALGISDPRSWSVTDWVSDL